MHVRPQPNPARRRGVRPLAGAAALALAGCAQMARLPPVDLVVPTAALPLPAVAAAAPPVVVPAPSGAIFQADRYRPLFESHRARIVGDIITVRIVEKVSAVQKSTSSVDRTGELSATLSALPFLKPSALTRSSASGSAGNTFEGKGTTENSNDFSGTISASVVQVLANGHLIVAAEKQIGVNANVDVLRFSGQIDPMSIAPGNSVLSTQIANVRVEQRGRGQQAEAQSMGWLARFFMSVLPI